MWAELGDGGLQVLAGEDLDGEAREERRAERLRSWLLALESAQLKG